ncbi:MBOAT family O-acyltransferase [Roseivirga sp.]|uniref:MBOAT family O-acyltransferase n=1 Tax=Roseivirga sp. TaxID=1964215 RepID=UPI003B8CEC9A
MLFNSIDFVLFLPLVFIIYWCISSDRPKEQNLFLLLASYFFYGCWNWKFLGLIAFSTLIDYLIGLALGKEIKQVRRTWLLMTSIFVNIGLLGFFKYYNFFLESFVDSFSMLGIEFSPNRLNILLPVGISFYTFQTLSYTIDVYRGKLAPTKDFIAFAAFVSYFPQLVAGPIERATHLLPQFFKRRAFSYEKAVNGMQQVLWGLVKKVIVADNCARIVDHIYANSDTLTASTLVLGILLFSFQVYGDFSGYSDIAIGLARLFGFNLKQNFNYPYFSRDYGEFWRRWHISISTWFRDYVYIPLGGNRGSKLINARNILIVFAISGLWHGANWTFILFGLFNGLFVLPSMLRGTHKKHTGTVAENRRLPTFREFFGMLSTFLTISFLLILFRANNLAHALDYFIGLFSFSIFSGLGLPNINGVYTTILIVIIFILIEWNGRTRLFAIENLGYGWKKSYRWAVYICITFAIIYLGAFDEGRFIYFQF